MTHLGKDALLVLRGKWQGALSASATKMQSAAKPVLRWRFVGLFCVDAKTGIPGEEPACGDAHALRIPIEMIYAESMHVCDDVWLLTQN